MPILRDLSLYWSMFHVVVLFLMLFRSKYPAKKTVILSTAAMSALMILNALGLWLLGLELMGKLLLLSCSIPSFLFFYFLSKDRDFTYLFTFCLADTACLWVLAATNLLDTYFGGGKFILMFLLRLIIFPVLEYLTYRYLRDFYHQLQRIVKKGWAAYAGMTLLYYLLIWLLMEYPTHITYRPEIVPALVVVLLLIVFSYVIMFFSLTRQYRLYERERTEQVLRERNIAVEVQLQNQQHLHKLKHNMRGHLITLQGLLQADKPQEALSYLQDLTASEQNGQKLLCQNPYINAVLSHYQLRFEKEGAVLQTDIRIGEEALPYLAICNILSNALENALEETVNLPKEQREASVQMQYRKDYLLIRVKNRCREGLEVKRGELPTTGKKGREHGFGLLSMKETAERFGGDMLCYTEHSCFVADIMLRHHR